MTNFSKYHVDIPTIGLFEGQALEGGCQDVLDRDLDEFPTPGKIPFPSGFSSNHPQAARISLRKTDSGRSQ
jgi:hypothetical protein